MSNQRQHRWMAMLLPLIAVFTNVWPGTCCRAASINYGDFGPVAPGVTFADVTELSGTDPVPLFSFPAPFAMGLDFDPIAFAATASGGGEDATDGRIEFVLQSNPLVAITEIALFEAGDFTLMGGGSAVSQANAVAILSATVTQINGANVSPVSLTPVNGSAGFNLLANPGIVQPWSLDLFLDVAAQLGPGQRATEIEVAIDNDLAAMSEGRSLAFIAKKDFRIEVDTEVVPEPATLMLLLSGWLAWVSVSRRLMPGDSNKQPPRVFDGW